MKKILASVLLLLLSVAASAQTFPVNNLVVNGTSQFTGQGNFTLPPTAPTPTTGDSSTKLATTAFVAGAIGTAAPTAANNAALQATSTASAANVWRLGFTTSGDAPPLLYVATAAPCTISAGAGDNGSQVRGANGNCWVANFSPTGPLEGKQWGARCDNSHDDTSAMQAAFNTGRVIHYPAGVCLFQSGLVQLNGGIVGDGFTQTVLAAIDTTSSNAITYSSNNPGYFANFKLVANNTKTGGSGLLVTASSGENSGTRIDSVNVVVFPVNITMSPASNWVIANSWLQEASQQNLLIANANNPDSGDSTIVASTFSNSNAVPSIVWNSSGGIKVIGSKINGGTFGFFVGFNGTASTSDILINGTSIENMTSSAIELSRSSGTSTVSNIEIVGNQLAINANAVSTDGSGAFYNVVVGDNVITMSSTTGSAIALTAVNGFYVGGNSIFGNGGSPSGIAISTGSTNGKIGKNTYINIPTTLSNLSTTTFYERDKQVVTTSITTGTAYGSSLFVGNANVSFPVAFTVAPEVTCTVGTSAGVSAFPLTVTKTGFLANAVSVTNGAVISVTCWAEGVI